MAKTQVQEPSTGLKFVGATRRQVGAVPGAPDDEVTYEGGCSCRFRTSGWPKKQMAEDRLAEHLREHAEAGNEDAFTTTELHEFKRAVGYDVDVAEAPSMDPFPDEGADNPILSVVADEPADTTPED